MPKGGKIQKETKKQRMMKRGWKLHSRITTGVILKKGNKRAFIDRHGGDPHIYVVG